MRTALLKVTRGEEEIETNEGGKREWKDERLAGWKEGRKEGEETTHQLPPTHLPLAHSPTKKQRNRDNEQTTKQQNNSFLFFYSLNDSLCCRRKKQIKRTLLVELQYHFAKDTLMQ